MVKFLLGVKGGGENPHLICLYYISDPEWPDRFVYEFFYWGLHCQTKDRALNMYRRAIRTKQLMEEFDF